MIETGPDQRKACWLFSMLLSLVILFNTSVQAENLSSDTPASLNFSLKKELHFIDIKSICTSKLSLNDRNKTFGMDFKSFAFADIYSLNLNPDNSGLWEDTEHGKIWRLGLTSVGAHSIYILLSTLKLAPGVSLFIYNEHYAKIIKIGSSINSNHQKGFSVAPLTGDRIIIELNIPSEINNYGQLTLSKLYHDRLNIFGRNSTFSLGKGTCEQNINCDNGTFWQTEKRSVCKIITDGALCTGTLIGNTSKDSTPYLLTAYHTIFDEKHAQEAIFIFNYEYLGCSPTPVNDLQTISGASLLATADGQDYSLLQLSEVPPASFKPFYAGWNIEEKTDLPATSIHHPNGSGKQIAIAYQNLKSASFNATYQSNAFWEVKWNLGSTAPGSSGAPLFNKRHQVIGSLTGGSASCNNTGNDYFNKLSSAWQNLEGTGTGLNQFLDAGSTGLTQLEGYDPYGFNLSNCEVAWNINQNEKLVNALDDKSREYLSSASMFAEQFSSATALTLPGFYFNVAALNRKSNQNFIKVKIWDGRSKPGRELYSQTLFLKDLHPGINEIALDSLVKTSGDFFIGYQMGNTEPDQFILFSAANRGKSGASTIYLFNEDWQAIRAVEDEYATSLAIGISECYGKIYPPKHLSIQAYPIPAESYLDFKLPNQLIANDVRCFDSSGKEVKVSFLPSELKNSVQFNLAPGLYVLQVNASEQIFYTKFTVSEH